MRALRPLFFASFALFSLSAAAAARDQDQETRAPLPPVRVQLASLGTPRRAALRASGEVKALDAGGERIETAGPAITVAASGDQVELGSHAAVSVRLEAESFSIGSGRTAKAYPHALLITAKGGRLSLVNECSLEDYTAGVLCGECPALFHPEAIRAMAVAVRSYSYRRAYLTDRPLCDTTHCQVYRGCGSVPAAIREAVHATEGLCALYEGEVIDAVYCSDCGGATAANDEVWKSTKPQPYLRTVEDAPEPEGEPYCVVNRSHGWKLPLGKARLQALYGKPAAGLKLAVTEVTESGRARRIEISPAAGEGGSGCEPPAKVFTGDEFRRLLGNEALKSLKFDVREIEAGVELVGTGWGHGVGMCQFGANGMAKQGAPFVEILQHYYTGVEVAPAPPVPPGTPRAAAARARDSISPPHPRLSP